LAHGSQLPVYSLLLRAYSSQLTAYCSLFEVFDLASTKIKSPRIAGITTCVPARVFDNLRDASEFTEDEVRKVSGMAGVSSRHIADDSICSSDLCLEAARGLLKELDWDPDSIDALIMVTQTPDYFLPSTACIVQHKLDLPDKCAAFDVGLGCSGYPYGLWLASLILRSHGFRRLLLLHGETPARFAEKSDRSVSLLFGDAGSATALEATDGTGSKDWTFVLNSDGRGYGDLIIEGGGFRDRFPEDPRKHFVFMHGANIFNFTIKRVPPLVMETLDCAGIKAEDVDYFIFHQANQFILKHLMNKLKLPAEKVPLILKEFGNAGGPSVPLTITKGGLTRKPDRPIVLMLLGFGVGLSWASALVELEPEAKLLHYELE